MINLIESCEVWNWFMKSTDNLGTLIGYIFVFFGLIFTARQWRRDQKWKQKEIVLKRIAAFSDTPGAHNAELMLWSADRDVPLWASDNPKERYIRIYRKQVATALIPDKFLEFQYSSFETAIRDSFEDFLSKLSLIEFYLEGNLIIDKDVDIKMRHIIRTFNNLNKGNDIDKTLIRHIYLFIDWIDFYGVKKLLKRYEIDVDKELENASIILEKQIADGKWVRTIISAGDT